jgi:2-polyprenyl-3-methyl-5-hydroxy-6-metoxy-1,4-benzoquinol methylase
MITSEIYDSMAPLYREYSERKSNYIRAIDRLIVDNIVYPANSLLDVGAGDGIRGMNIAKEKNIKYTVLSDISEEMSIRYKDLSPSDIWHYSADNLPDSEHKFDVILCLWNVPVHIENKAKRLTALNKMRALLSDKGSLFIDVNNRHNAVSYGWFKVFYRIIIDKILPNENRGDTYFKWNIGNKVINAMGHLFTPDEVRTLFNNCNFDIKKMFAVNYNTGEICSSNCKGQLFFILSKINQEK